MSQVTLRRAGPPQAEGPSAPAGYTLLEMLIALTVFAVIFGAAVAMMGQQVKGFAQAGESGAALQNVRFSIEELERSARAAGIRLGTGQPMLIYADSNVLAFNGDYKSNTPNDMDAIFVDAGAPEAGTVALGKANRFTLPGTSFGYPDTTYLGSEAETLIFFFRRDSSTSRTDDYILFRQANQQPAEVVSRDLRHSGTTPFFQYLRLSTPTTGAPFLDSVRTSALPLVHDSAMHMSQGDVGRSAALDSVRAVRVSFTAGNGAPAGPRQVSRSVSRLIRFPNAGLQAFQTCGEQPVTPGNFTLDKFSVNGRDVPRLSWTASTDETSGERDVVRYVIYRVIGAPGATLGDPYFNLPANGAANYTWTDEQAETGTLYSYAVAAEDCTPQVGSPTASASVQP